MVLPTSSWSSPTRQGTCPRWLVFPLFPSLVSLFCFTCLCFIGQCALLFERWVDQKPRQGKSKGFGVDMLPRNWERRPVKGVFELPAQRWLLEVRSTSSCLAVQRSCICALDIRRRFLTGLHSLKGLVAVDFGGLAKCSPNHRGSSRCFCTFSFFLWWASKHPRPDTRSALPLLSLHQMCQLALHICSSVTGPIHWDNGHKHSFPE